jgi:divalent metal cation (Fe/Co/Zn/Cd) transporter
VWTSAKEIGLRIMDGIEPERVEAIRHEAGHIAGVLEVGEVRARWLGHSVRAEVNVVVPAETSVEDGHAVAVAVRTRLVERVEHLDEAMVHIDPPSAPGEAHHEPPERGGQARGHERYGHATRRRAPSAGLPQLGP